MTAVELIEKACTKCEQTKPLSEFHRQKTSADGHRSWCKDCMREHARTWAENERERMGEDEFRAYRAEIVRRHRDRTGNETGKQYDKARRKATAELIKRHRGEFDHLLLLAQRGEL